MRSFAVGGLASSLVVVAACFTGGPSSSNDPDAAIGSPTFYKDVLPILQDHCQQCHVQGGIAPFALLTYDDAHANSDAMVADTQGKIMPPWGAQQTSECTTRYGFVGDPSLSANQIATIAAWHTQGDVAGNPSDAPPPNNTVLPTDLPGSPVELAPTTPYSLPATQETDYFRCFVLDPQLTAQTYITGFNIKPGNKTIVHHSLVYAVPAGVTIPTDQSPNPVPNQYDCFGGPGIPNPELVALWAPGGVPYQYPDGVGHPIAAGTKFIMQIHYHPHANATLDPDTTTFQYTTTSVTPSWTVGTVLLGNYDKPVANGTGLEEGTFLIPADTNNVVRTMDTSTQKIKLPVSVHALMVAAHMHLVGTNELITMTRANPDASNPASECLLAVPQWSFNWQRGYQYDSPDLNSLPLVSNGDAIKIRCTYNNTMSNAALAESLTEAGQKQTAPVDLGESTTDEMCLGAFWYVYQTL
jgi:hypothetical protein